MTADTAGRLALLTAAMQCQAGRDATAQLRILQLRITNLDPDTQVARLAGILLTDWPRVYRNPEELVRLGQNIRRALETDTLPGPRPVDAHRVDIHG